MLPFLKNQHEAGMSAPMETIKRKPDGENREFDMLDAVAEDLYHGLKVGNLSRIRQALESLIIHIQDLDELQDQDQSYSQGDY